MNNLLSKRLYAGTIPANKEYAAGTVPSNKKYAAGTPKKFHFSKKIPNPLQAPISAAPKVPEFCPEVEENPVP